MDILPKDFWIDIHKYNTIASDEQFNNYCEINANFDGLVIKNTMMDFDNSYELIIENTTVDFDNCIFKGITISGDLLINFSDCKVNNVTIKDSIFTSLIFEQCEFESCEFSTVQSATLNDWDVRNAPLFVYVHHWNNFPYHQRSILYFYV